MEILTKKIKDFEDKVRIFLKKLNEEGDETREAAMIVQKYLKDGVISEEDEKKLKEQFFDILKIAGIGIPFVLIPGASVILPIIVSLAKKYDINLLPSKFNKNQDMKKTVLYTCVLLDKVSHNLLLSTFNKEIPHDWKRIAHHMTIMLGGGIEESELGKKIQLTVTHIGINEKAIAVLVTGYDSKNPNPHVTLAVNPISGKPKDSNTITNWVKVVPFTINGVVTEITK